MVRHALHGCNTAVMAAPTPSLRAVGTGYWAAYTQGPLWTRPICNGCMHGCEYIFLHDFT